MATVERSKNITVMKYNTFDGKVDISIRDARGDEVLLLHDDVLFLHKTLTKWIWEFEEGQKAMFLN